MKGTPRMSEPMFRGLSDEEMARLAAIPERQELFETRLLHLADASAGSEESVFVVTRDPGSAATLLPVVRELRSQYGIDFLTDGRALETLQNQKDMVLEDANAGRSPLHAAQEAMRPATVLLTHTTSEQGADTFAAETYAESPIVFVEDMYGAAEKFMERVQKMTDGAEVMARVRKVCVPDEPAKAYLAKQYPAVADRIVVTGQPLYDRISGEPRDEMRQEVREGLHIEDDEKFVVFFGASSTDDLPGTPHVRIALEHILQEIEEMNNLKIKFVFTNHPRDPVSQEEYQQMLDILKEKGIRIADAKRYSSDHLQAAADAVVSLPHSTLTYDAIYRRKPVLVPTVQKRKHERPMPAVESGAVIEVDDLSLFGASLEAALNPSSEAVIRMQKNQDHFFPEPDGKNASRIALAVEEVITESHSL